MAEYKYHEQHKKMEAWKSIEQLSEIVRDIVKNIPEHLAFVLRNSRRFISPVLPLVVQVNLPQRAHGFPPTQPIRLMAGS